MIPVIDGAFACDEDAKIVIKDRYGHGDDNKSGPSQAPIDCCHCYYTPHVVG